MAPSAFIVKLVHLKGAELFEAAQRPDRNIGPGFRELPNTNLNSLAIYR
jgi:hypothetical protein